MSIRTSDAAKFDKLCEKLQKVDSKIFLTRKYVGYILPRGRRPLPFDCVVPILNYNGEIYNKAF